MTTTIRDRYGTTHHATDIRDDGTMITAICLYSGGGAYTLTAHRTKVRVDA